MESTINGLQVELMAQAKGLLFVNSHHDGTDLLTIVSSIDISGGSAVYLAFGFSKEHPPGDPHNSASSNNSEFIHWYE